MRLLIALLLLVVTPSSVGAEPLRVLVRVAAAEDQDFLQRLRGQVADVDVELVAVETAPLEPRVHQQLARARALAAARDARVAVWFGRSSGGAALAYVAELDAGTIFVREITRAGADPLAGSAVAEAVALTVRSALRALRAGGRIGVAPEQLEAPPPAPPPALSAAPEQPARAPLRWQGRVAWQAVLDGYDAAGTHGLLAEIGARRERFGAAVEVALARPLTLRDPLTVVELGRYAVGASLSFQRPLGRSSRASVGLALGAVAFTRQASALAPDVMVTGDQTTLAGFVGPVGRLVWQPWGAGAPALVLSAGADVVLGAPRLGYQQGEQFVVRDAPWPVQPRFGLGVLVEPP